MQCVYCTSEGTRVVDSRESGPEIRRRRECESCEKRFTTYERAELSLMVIKKDGSKQPFEREKIKAGMIKACEKRPVSEEVIEKAVREIELRLSNKGEITSKHIGELVLKKLKKMDDVAYLRFASVCRGFESAKQFHEEVKTLMR